MIWHPAEILYKLCSLFQRWWQKEKKKREEHNDWINFIWNRCNL